MIVRVVVAWIRYIILVGACAARAGMIIHTSSHSSIFYTYNDLNTEYVVTILNSTKLVHIPSYRWTTSYKQAPAMSAIDCGRQCVRDRSCVSVNYPDVGGTCELNSEGPAILAGVMATTPGWSLYVKSEPCPNTWQIYNHWCYHYSAVERNWTAAVEYCHSLQAQLVEFDDKAENDFVLSLVKHVDATIGFWMGLSNMGGTGRYQWESGNVVNYFNWAPNEPDYYPGEHCVEMRMMNDFWNDVYCSKTFYCVCERHTMY